MAPTGLSGERVPCRTQAAVTSNTGNSPGSRHTSCPFTLPRGAHRVAHGRLKFYNITPGGRLQSYHNAICDSPTQGDFEK